MISENIHLNRLVACSHPLLERATQLLKDSTGSQLSDQFKEQIFKEFEQFERACFAQQLDVHKVKQAKYALAAFIDEVVITSQWPGRLNWMGQTLQLQFFGEHLAGEGFFKHLQELMASPHKNLDVLEVYYICLQLGYKGRYRLQNHEQLLGLVVDLRSQLELGRGPIDPRLAPQAIPKQHVITRMSREIPLWVMGSVAAAILLMVYMGYSVAIQHQADKTQTLLQANTKILIQDLAQGAEQHANTR